MKKSKAKKIKGTDGSCHSSFKGTMIEEDAKKICPRCGGNIDLPE